LNQVAIYWYSVPHHPLLFGIGEHGPSSYATDYRTADSLYSLIRPTLMNCEHNINYAAAMFYVSSAPVAAARFVYLAPG